MPTTTHNPTSHSPSLILPLSIREAIVDHAREGKPEEICGLLRGRNGVVTGMLRARNVAPNPITDYEVDPTALLVQFQWEDEGDKLIAIYHSHPEDPAYPSASDAINAYYPDAVYIICSLLDDENPDLKGYLMRGLRAEIDLEAVRQELPFYETRPGRWASYLPADAPTPECLAHAGRPRGLALYVVYQKDGGESGQVEEVRLVTVEPVRLQDRDQRSEAGEQGTGDL